MTHELKTLCGQTNYTQANPGDLSASIKHKEPPRPRSTWWSSCIYGLFWCIPKRVSPNSLPLFLVWLSRANPIPLDTHNRAIHTPTSRLIPPSPESHSPSCRCGLPREPASDQRLWPHICICCPKKLRLTEILEPHNLEIYFGDELWRRTECWSVRVRSTYSLLRSHTGASSSTHATASI